MHSDRIFGICVLSFGCFLLLYLIPSEVATGRGFTGPSRFPRIAAWLFIGLGALHAAVSVPGMSWPSLREAIRIVMVLAIVIGGCLLMQQMGYLVAAIAIMAALTLLMREKRLHWIILTVAVIPFALYLFFVLLLNRALPTASLF